ncbi:MAG: AAA family ATPase, partial [Gallionellaceae bacterium]
VQNNRSLKYIKPEFDANKVLSAATENQAVFSKAYLHCLVAQELQGVGDADEMQQRLDWLKKSGELVQLGKHDNQMQYTTKEILRLEQSIVDFAKAGRSKEDWEVLEEAISNAIAVKKGISQEQQKALRHVCGKGQVVSVTGAAGTGKSFMLAAARDAFEKSGFKVSGCSLSGKAAAELQGGSGIQSQTIHSLMQEIDSGKRQLSNKDVLIMDESGMTDTRLMSRVIDAVKAADAKLVLVGDTAQLQAIGAGGTFGKVSAEIGSAEILKVRRQKVGWQKQAANDFRAGRAGEALAAYKAHQSLHIHKTTKGSHTTMVERWRSVDAAQSEKIMIAGRRVDVAKLNRIARSQLKQSGELGAEATVVTSDKEGNEGKTKVAEGERLKLTKNDKSLGVMNGDLVTVRSIEIDKTGNTILDVRLDRGGESVRINTGEYSQFQHGYCITAHASQGATVDNTLFYASSFNSKEMAYVSASRQRYGCEIFASEEEVG